MLNLYTNIQFLSETHRREVFPLLFDIYFLKNEMLKKYFQLVDAVETCNIVVIPIDYKSFNRFPTELKLLLKEAKDNNKPLWIYTAGDFGYSLKNNSIYNFRLGGFHSKLNDRSFIMPSFINDPYLSLEQEFSVLKKEEKPSIGFVGHAKSGNIKYFKEFFNYLKLSLKQLKKETFFDNQRFYPASIERANYLKVLDKSDVLNTNFVLRSSYRAGASTIEKKKTTTEEFYDNMYRNGYTFCSRGVGNFSVRFYETLAMGRIPILLNTDCRLPLNTVIDWSKHCLIIDANNKKTVIKQIIDFHNSIPPDKYEILQQSNRELWLNKLRRDKYFIEIYKQFKSNIE